MAYTFDGVNKRIVLGPGTVLLDLLDLYSRWKDWVRQGNAGVSLALRSVGGDIPAIPLYLFLLNGWKIVPQAADHSLVVDAGVLEVEGGGEPFVDPVGAFKIRITRQVPGIAIGYSTTGVAAPSVEQIVSAMVEALTAAQLPVNVMKVNNVQLQGTGVAGDSMRPV